MWKSKFYTILLDDMLTIDLLSRKPLQYSTSHVSGTEHQLINTSINFTGMAFLLFLFYKRGHWRNQDKTLVT